MNLISQLNKEPCMNGVKNLSRIVTEPYVNGVKAVPSNYPVELINPRSYEWNNKRRIYLQFAPYRWKLNYSHIFVTLTGSIG